MSWETLVYLIFTAILVGLAYSTGYQANKPVVTEELPVVRKKYKPKYKASDLLDPITPEDQRLERAMEVRERGRVTDGDEDDNRR